MFWVSNPVNKTAPLDCNTHRVGAIGHAYEGEISSDDIEGASRVLASAGAGWLSPAAGGRMLFESPAEVLGSASRLCENLAAGVGSLRPAGILGV